MHIKSMNKETRQIYSVWTSMKSRCYNPRDADYKRYGKIGIRVSLHWRISFERFLTDMGPRPAGYQIERIDNDGDYEASNCCWASRIQQANNRGHKRWHVINDSNNDSHK